MDELSRLVTNHPMIVLAVAIFVAGEAAANVN